MWIATKLLLDLKIETLRHAYTLSGVAMSGDLNHINLIKVWDLARGFCIRTIFCYSACNTVAVSADGLIASGHHNSNIVFWDLRNGECIANLGGIHRYIQL